MIPLVCLSRDLCSLIVRPPPRCNRTDTPVTHATLFRSLLATLPRLDLIKIDVEGHEEPVIRAIDTQLTRLAPRAILFEDQGNGAAGEIGALLRRHRSEEHTSELQSVMRISYAVLSLNRKLTTTHPTNSETRLEKRQ